MGRRQLLIMSALTLGSLTCEPTDMFFTLYVVYGGQSAAQCRDLVV